MRATSGALANILTRMCKFREAEERVREIVEWCDAEERRASWPTCLQRQADFAMLVGLLGDPQRGAVLAEAAHTRAMEITGPHRNYTAGTLYTLGLNLQWIGEDEQAEERFHEYLAQCKQTGQSDGMARFFLARSRLLQGDITPEEALPILQRYVEAQTDPMQPVMGDMGLTALAQCLVRLDRFEDADDAMQRNPGEFTAAVAPDHFEERLHRDTLNAIEQGLNRAEQAVLSREQPRPAETVKPPD